MTILKGKAEYDEDGILVEEYLYEEEGGDRKRNGKLFKFSFEGHRGRPGLIGGSLPRGAFSAGEEETATLDKEEERKKARREARRRRREARKQREREQKIQQSSMTPNQKRIAEFAIAMGFPPERLELHTERGPAFEVNGKTYYTGGNFNPLTGRITMYRTENTPMEEMQGMLAHEIMHSKWQAHKEVYQKQFVEIQMSVRSSDNIENWLIRADGTLKNPDDVKKFWAYDININYVNTSSKRWSRLQKSDGISEYSRQYWQKANNSGSAWDYDRAVDETLAEIARIKTNAGRTGDKKTIRPIWESLYRRVQLGTAE